MTVDLSIPNQTIESGPPDTSQMVWPTTYPFMGWTTEPPCCQGGKRGRWWVWALVLGALLLIPEKKRESPK